MTDGTTPPLTFASLDRRRGAADCAGGDLSTEAGALRRREADRRRGLRDAVSR